MARQQEHIAPSEVQIKPGTLEETYKSILRGKLLNEEDLPTIVGQLKSMSVRRSEFECLQAEVGALRVDLETFKKECCGIRTRDFVRGVIQRTSGVDQRELVLQYGQSKAYIKPRTNFPQSSKKLGVTSGQTIQSPKLTVKHFAPLWTCYNKSAHNCSMEEVHAIIDESLWNYEFFQEWIHQRSEGRISCTKEEFMEYATSVSPSELKYMLELEKNNAPYALLVATYYMRIKYSLPYNDAATRAPFETLETSWSDVYQKALALELKKTSNLRDFCRSVRYTLVTTPYDVQPYHRAVSLLHLFALGTKHPQDLLHSFGALERSHNIDSRASPSNPRGYHTMLNRESRPRSATLFRHSNWPASLISVVRRPSARRPWPNVTLIGPNQPGIRSLFIRALSMLRA